MIEVTFRKKMTDEEILKINNWASEHVRGTMLHGIWAVHPDGSRTHTYYFSSEKDAMIFKLRFA